jgi:hypothetical protein
MVKKEKKPSLSVEFDLSDEPSSSRIYSSPSSHSVFHSVGVPLNIFNPLQILVLIRSK